MRRRSAGWASACLVLAVLLGGCLGGFAEGEILSSTPAPTPPRPVVIALLDTGIDPYHEAFSAAAGPDAATYADTFGARAITVGEDKAPPPGGAQADDWTDLEKGTLYAFPGTRVLGISLAEVDLPAVRDFDGHGTGTASMAAREAPDAIIVMVQVDMLVCRPECFPQAAVGMEWAASQPWIDVISVSIGIPGNPPHPDGIDPDARRYVAAAKKATDAGKLVVSASGNYVGPPLAAPFSGPSWIIAVGGVQEGPRGESIFASKGVDVVANFTEWAADANTGGMSASSGTSYAGPIVAGVLADALQTIRNASGPIPVDAVAMRTALNASAIHFSPTEWDPSQWQSNDTLNRLLSTNVPIVAPFAQMGWGYVDGRIADEVARRVLENDLEPPWEKAATAQYMARWQSLREEYWRGQA